MTDYTELKRLAKLAVSDMEACGERWPIEDDWFEPGAFSSEMSYVRAAEPSIILALIAENEALRKDAERYRFVSQHERKHGWFLALERPTGISIWTGASAAVLIDAAMANSVKP